MSLQAYWDNFASQPTRWADADAEHCGCKGGGWWLSELDTWHKCPHHAPGASHPEDDCSNAEAEADALFRQEHPVEAAAKDAAFKERLVARRREEEEARAERNSKDIPF